ncbi:energy transducer TonB [Sphingomonas hankyongi]|uniref:Energy transducer TonB n=1 Tax=Sphingomonas hankyongi TaxID=2908209 RepID=A0ABT0S1V8_9SPHN|nr:energy transducer TonB [Sphingomonas hankyongi]MCL6729834.1 energy transducer TonB [Sphingomonas hankyongi]
MIKRVACYAVVGASALVAATPAIGAPLQPLKPWVLDVGEAQCTATREFGKAEDPVTLVIRPAPNGETYELILMRHQVGSSKYASQYPGSVDFGGTPIKVQSLKFRPKDQRLTQHHFRISQTEMQQAKQAPLVTFRSEGLLATSLALRNMPAVLEGLTNCTADLMRYWNTDGVNVGTVAVPSKSDVRTLFTTDDYPMEAFARNQQGTAQFLLLIDTDGKVAACHVVKASGVPSLDGMGCQALRQRATFKPALDRHGKPVRSTYTTPPVSWRLEG